MKTMTKNIYITPETDICLLCMNGQVLQGYTIIDLSNPKPSEVTGGEINSNSDDIWESETSNSQDDNPLWDKL